MENFNPLVNIRDSENSIRSTDIGIGSTNAVCKYECFLGCRRKDMCVFFSIFQHFN